MERGEGLGEPFVISGEPAKARGPAEALLDHPAARQQHEATFGLAVFDHLQLNAMPGGRARGNFSPVPLIDIAQLDLVAGDALHLFWRIAPPGRGPARWRQ